MPLKVNRQAMLAHAVPTGATLRLSLGWVRALAAANTLFSKMSPSWIAGNFTSGKR